MNERMCECSTPKLASVREKLHYCGSKPDCGQALNKVVSLPDLTSVCFLPGASVSREFPPINYSFAQGHLLFVSSMLRKSKTVCHRMKFLIKIRLSLSRGGKCSKSNTVQPGSGPSSSHQRCAKQSSALRKGKSVNPGDG